MGRGGGMGEAVLVRLWCRKVQGWGLRVCVLSFSFTFNYLFVHGHSSHDGCVDVQYTLL